MFKCLTFLLNSFNRDKFIHSINNDEEMTKVMVSISWCMPPSSTIIVAWLNIRWEEKIWEKYSNQVKMEWTSDSTQTIKVAGGIDTILPRHGILQQRLVPGDYGITMMMITQCSMWWERSTKRHSKECSHDAARCKDTAYCISMPVPMKTTSWCSAFSV